MFNRKIAISTVSILSAMALLGGSAFAVFSSSASNNGNTFGAGNMVLNINNLPGGTSTPVFGVSGAIPGASFDQKLTLKNTGSVAASNVKVSSIDVGGANPDLAGALTLMLFNDANDNGVFDAGDSSLGSGHLNDPSWVGYTLPAVTLAASGGTFNLGARITFDLSADDSFQGKNVAFNFNFVENQ